MIHTYAQVDKDGNVTTVCQFESSEDNFLDPTGTVRFVTPPDGVDHIELMESWKWRNDKWETVGSRPSQFHRWDANAGWQFDADAAWAAVRYERRVRLGSTDWTQLPDVPEALRSKYVPYRQALRDITEQADPTAIEWPALPAE